MSAGLGSEELVSEGLVAHPDGLSRCWWCGTDPLYTAYHDTEWGVPEYDGRALFEKLILDGFQAGLSWITILRKRDAFRAAFAEFDPEAIAAFGPERVEALMGDAGIVRNRAKIVGTVASARAWLAMGGAEPFSRFLWKHVGGAPLQPNRAGRGAVPPATDISRDISAKLKRAGFTFVGPTIVYAFMEACGLVNDHLVGCHRHVACGAPPGGVSPAAPRAWQRMLSGRRLDLLDPSPLDIEIDDIAHGLARVARWNGQTAGEHVFSVAQHSLLVEAIAASLEPGLPDPARLGILLHDAPEYVIGDIITPLKHVIGTGYASVEARLRAAIHLRVGLPATQPAVLARLTKRADRIAAYLEATRLAGFTIAEADEIFGRPRVAPPRDDDLTPWPTELAESRFRARVAALSGG